MNIALVPLENVADVWDRVEPLLAKAMKIANDRYRTIDLLDQILRGEQFLWIAFDEEKEIKAAITTRLIDYPGKRVLSLQFCGGDDMEQWLSEFHDTLEKFARAEHCEAMELVGRKGWVRALEDKGWSSSLVLVEKELNDG